MLGSSLSNKPAPIQTPTKPMASMARRSSLMCVLRLSTVMIMMKPNQSLTVPAYSCMWHPREIVAVSLVIWRHSWGPPTATLLAGKVRLVGIRRS